MANRGESDRVSVHLEATEAGRPARPLPGTPFLVALLGDFSGRGTRAGAAPRDVDSCRPLLVDRDDVDEVLARLAPVVHLRPAPDAPPAAVRIRELDDFHPDRLLAALPELAALRGVRERLSDPRTSSRTVQELLGPGEGTGARETPARGAVPVSGAALLEQIVTDAAGPAARPAAPPPEEDELRRFVRHVLAGHVVADADPRQGSLQTRVDQEIGARVAAVLHDPGFQAVEALWRGVQLLVRRLDTGPELKLFLLDVTREELAADLLDRPVEQSGLYRLLVDETVGTPGAAPWAILAGCYTFGPDAGDARLLGQLAAVARAAGAPWLSAAEPRLTGWTSFEETPEPESWRAPDAPGWEELRRRPEAAWLGLVAPRFILRLPYGAEDEPCESFAFEELSAVPVHEHFLWGNPALAAALLLAETFSLEGWGLRAGARAEIGGLPLPLLRQPDGEARVIPCAEALLPERSAAKMLEAGIMPLASLKERDAVRLVYFQSIARAPLPGRWLTTA